LAWSESAAPLPQEAHFYKKLENGTVRCQLCPRSCLIPEGKRGYCGTRENRGKTLYSMVYARVSTAQVDAIEKKPLFHFLPGTKVFSIATAGCNVNCKFCQNWDLSQSLPEQLAAEFMPPERVVELARHCCCPSIAFTYNEPTVFAEFVMDTTETARAAGVRSVVVSNGYIQHDAMKEAYSKVDAVKIDLKAFTEPFYAKVVGGGLKAVLKTLTTLRTMGKWTEIVYLVIPTLNDSDEELRNLSAWIKANLGPDVPLHFTRYHPEYLLRNIAPTPVATLERAKAIADAEGLHYVYIGNVAGQSAQDTYCPRCGNLLVARHGFTVTRMLINRTNACPFCANAIPGI
jgi:pyruvate formate lyase activating enzyme